MAFSIKTKQVVAVTFLVSLIVILLSGWYVSSVAGVLLEETESRAALLESQVRHRLQDIALTEDAPAQALQDDGGFRSILQSVIYSKNTTYALIVDSRGVVLASSLPSLYEVGEPAPAAADLAQLLALGPVARMHAIFFQTGRSFEHRSERLRLGDEDISVRIGVSTFLMRGDLTENMKTPLVTAIIGIIAASLLAMVLAQLTLRPIHVIRSGLARLGRGELDVNVELPEGEEMTELGDSFRAVSARLAADRTALAGQRATLESVVENLEDAMALFSPDGTLLFANPAMAPALPAGDGSIETLFPPGHPYRKAVESVLETRESYSPVTAPVPSAGERMILAHPFENAEGELLGVMLVARNISYIAQVESTLNYSRKLATLGKLSAGIAHEVKNPLNATMIHLELLRMRLSDVPEALEHVRIITAQMRRLDEVVQGFLKFTRPEDLRLQPVALAPLVADMRPILAAEATPRGIEIETDVAATLPPVSADSGMLHQAFLNLALNACQAMPNGGRLRIAATRTPNQQIEVVFQDTGVGIPPEHLERIFDLYFTTRQDGSGIGLSLVYRTIQLHDGEIVVESTPGHGTTFRILLPEAPRPARGARPPTNILGLSEPSPQEAGGVVPAS